VTNTLSTKTDKSTTSGWAPSAVGRRLRGFAEDRVGLLLTLMVALLIIMSVADVAGLLRGPFNADYLAAALISVVPLAMLGLAQLLVITSGGGGIDLSVGSMVSVSGIAFGFLYGIVGVSLPVAIMLTILVGALCGAINGGLVVGLGFPPLIATLATFYVFRSLALVMSGQRPINTPAIQDFYAASAAVEIPIIGSQLPLIPIGIFTFLIPVMITVWFFMNRTNFGRLIYAVGTNDIAAAWSGVNVKFVRFMAYVGSGAISGATAIYIVAQFASARPDAGNSGNGLALPSITIAVLGGVAITGGIGRVSGVILSALLIVWVNASILLAFPGNEGVQLQLLALGTILILASIVNGTSSRSKGMRRRRAPSEPLAIPKT